jgi:hypothetical protein
LLWGFSDALLFPVAAAVRQASGFGGFLVNFAIPWLYRSFFDLPIFAVLTSFRGQVDRFRILD